jgi:hypothetical protein
LWKVNKKIKQITISSPLRTPQGTLTRNNAEKAHNFFNPIHKEILKKKK